MREPDAFALGFQRRQILPGFAVAPRATFATRRQYFKYVIIYDQGLIAAIRCALPQGPVRAGSSPPSLPAASDAVINAACREGLCAALSTLATSATPAT
jgi:nitroreductase